MIRIITGQYIPFDSIITSLDPSNYSVIEITEILELIDRKAEIGRLTENEKHICSTSRLEFRFISFHLFFADSIKPKKVLRAEMKQVIAYWL